MKRIKVSIEETSIRCPADSIMWVQEKAVVRNQEGDNHQTLESPDIISIRKNFLFFISSLVSDILL